MDQGLSQQQKRMFGPGQQLGAAIAAEDWNILIIATNLLITNAQTVLARLQEQLDPQAGTEMPSGDNEVPLPE